MKPPAFPLYADDFLAGTFDLTDAEVGLYFRLLCVQWNRGALPNDDAELLRFSRGGHDGSAIGRVKAKFAVGPDGMLRNDRMERVRAEQEDFRAAKAAAGRAGADKRWQTHSTPIGLPLAGGMANDSSPSPSPIPSPKSLVSPPRVSTSPDPERARGETSAQEPDPNYLPPAPRRPANPCRRKPADLQECLAMAFRTGWDASEASRWYSDMEAGGWAKVDGTPFGNWPREMSIARDRAKEQKEKLKLYKSNGDRSAPEPSDASKILRELDGYEKGPPPPIREIKLAIVPRNSL